MTPIANRDIRRRADGSIDTEFYLARVRVVRSRHARRLFSSLGASLRSVGARLMWHIGLVYAMRGKRDRTREGTDRGRYGVPTRSGGNSEATMRTGGPGRLAGQPISMIVRPGS